MQRNTPVDYAEFLLTHSRTRCELHIFANGVREKLASGYFKPFAMHLRAAEAQFAKGNQVIRLERPLNLVKKNKVTWFTKGTLERFVRFVSTPEVLERVTSIEDELSQLENVRVTLSKTFSESEVPYQAMNFPYSSPGAFQANSGILMMRQNSSLGADDSGADTSKIELLRAMDVRLVALKQEQIVVFSRAEAAGFDSSNMADLLDFSEHFGAERLRDACIQFITLFRKRTTAQETCQESESPLADAASSGSDMSLESGTDFEPIAKTELKLPCNVKEAWPKVLKRSVSSVAERQMVLNLKPALKEEKDSSTSHTSARTRSRWGPPERIQINYIEPELCSLQGSKLLRKVGGVKQQVEMYTPQDDSSRHNGNEMNTFQAGEAFHSTVHLEKQFSLPKQLPLMQVSGSPRATKQQVDKEGDIINKGGMFFSSLHKMAQQVEARRSGEDQGVRFTSLEMSDESPGSQVSAIGDSSVFESVLKSSESIPSTTVADRVFPQLPMQETELGQGHLPPGTSPMLQENLKLVNLHSAKSSSSITSAAEHSSIEDEVKKRKDSNTKPGEVQERQSENDKIEDNQEKPVSTSARRLSVQAAISLFEGKKANAGEPPTRKLVRQESHKGALQRQDSQKGPAQGGSSTFEKSVLRRWSAVGSNSIMDIEDKTSDLAGKQLEKAVEMEHVTRINEAIFRNSSVEIDKVPHLETDKGSTQANNILRNAFPHLSSAHQSASDTSDVSSKPLPSAQHRAFVRDSAHLRGAQQSGPEAPNVSLKTMPSAQQQSFARDSAILSTALQSAHDSPDASFKHMPAAKQQSFLRDSVNLSSALQSSPHAPDVSVNPIPSAKQQSFVRDSVHLSSDLQSVGDAPDLSSNPMSAAQQQSFVKDSATWFSDALHRQFKRELEQSLAMKAHNNVRMEDALISKSGTGSSKTSDVTIKRHSLESKTEIKEEERASVSDVVVEVRGHLGKEEDPKCEELTVKITPESMVANERAMRRQPGLEEIEADSFSPEILQIRKLSHGTEQGLLVGHCIKPEKDPSLLLLDTPVDLYMQALVMMIDNQQQRSTSLGDVESHKQQRGKFYDHYLRLRNARQREEPPAKRAEKEAKLKSMKETLERRKAEMEAGGLRQKKKGSDLVREPMHWVQKSGPLINQSGEEELGEGQEVGQQDQLSYVSRTQVHKTKTQVPKKTAPNLQKSASARRSMTTATSSLKSMPRKSTGTDTTVNRSKLMGSSYDGSMGNLSYGTLPVDPSRDLVSTAASVKLHEKINGGQSQFVNDTAAEVDSRNETVVVDVLSRSADVDFSRQLSPTRKIETLAYKGETPYTQALDQSVLESLKGHQEAGPEALSTFVAQNVKLFLQKGHGILPGPGTCAMKETAADSENTLKRYDEEAFSGSNGHEEPTPAVSSEIGNADFRKSLELDDLNCTGNHAVFTPSTSLDMCRSNGDGSHLLNKTSPDSLDQEAGSCVFEDATNDERILCCNGVDQEKHESELSKDGQVAGKFSDGDDFPEKESGTSISAEKMTELSLSDSNSSPSVFQDCTTSNYSDAASPETCFEGHPVMVLGAYSPKPALRTGSPLGSPISWKSFKTKHSSENDFLHSQGSPQKWVSTTSQQASKEPARGFKRLLHFARKSRASDGSSVFTTSEGDIENEESKEFTRLASGELLGIGKSQGKGSDKDPYVFRDQGASK